MPHSFHIKTDKQNFSLPTRYKKIQTKLEQTGCYSQGSESTQFGSPKVSPASPRCLTTKTSTLTVNAMENLVAVEKTPFGGAVHN